MFGLFPKKNEPHTKSEELLDLASFTTHFTGYPYEQTSEPMYEAAAGIIENLEYSVDESDGNSEPVSSVDKSGPDKSSASASRLIPKPPGEAGRPTRGGYTLEIALNWRDGEYETVRKHIKKLINGHFDVTKTFRFQDERMIEVVCKKAAEKFPKLNQYDKQWATIDLIKSQLICANVRERRKARRREAIIAEYLARNRYEHIL